MWILVRFLLLVIMGCCLCNMVSVLLFICSVCCILFIGVSVFLLDVVFVILL